MAASALSKGRIVFSRMREKSLLRLDDARITGLWVWREYIRAGGGYRGKRVGTGCGDFGFNFYIFDFSRGIEGRFALSAGERNVLKRHRVYLYRDGMRVYSVR